MKFIDTYKEANIYSIDRLKRGRTGTSGIKTFIKKIKAEGRHPDQINMKVELFAEAPTQAEALEQIRNKIDRYLDDHKMERFERVNKAQL